MMSLDYHTSVLIGDGTENVNQIDETYNKLLIIYIILYKIHINNTTSLK